QAQLQAKQQPATASDIEAQRQAVAQAQAQLALKQHPYTDDDLAAAQAAVEQANGQVESAQYNLDQSVLKAPFAGIVSQIGLNPGELATGAGTVGGGSITLVDPSQVHVEANVDESDVSHVQVGQPVVLTFDALPGQQVPGQVTAVAPQSTTTQGVTSYLVTIATEGGEGVRPGMTATANIVYAQQDGALLVPNRAIRRQGRDQVVDVLTAGGQVETRVVQRGISNDQVTEITGGLAEGDQVVIPTTQTRAPSAAGGAGLGGGLPTGLGGAGGLGGVPRGR